MASVELGQVQDYSASASAKANLIVVVGTQWGDEGKGKLVDHLAQKSLACGRFNGGANAGHTVVAGNSRFSCHLLPCGILNPECMNVIGSGVVVDLETLTAELAEIERCVNLEEGVLDNRFMISARAHLTFRLHRAADASSESDKEGTPNAIGTTLRGIGPSYATQALRIGLRACDLLLGEAEFRSKYLLLASYITRSFKLGYFDTEAELSALAPLRKRFAPRVCELIPFYGQLFTRELPPLNRENFLESSYHMVIEAANATMLDITMGSYPYCTSSSTLASGVGSGLAIPPRHVKLIVGVAKAYCTRVGQGPFPTELADSTGEQLRNIGAEFGASTGRPRRCGWLDAVMLRYSHAVNGLDCIMLTKLDVLSTFKVLKIATAYRSKKTGKITHTHHFPADLNDLGDLEPVYQTFPGWEQDISECRVWEMLPIEARNYVLSIEKLTQIPISHIGVGPERQSIIIKPVSCTDDYPNDS